MNGGEVDRRISERDAADRQYNDALTNVDRALPRLVDGQPPAVSLDLDISAIRDRLGILPAQPPDGSGLRGRLARFVWRLVAPVFTRQQELNAQVATHLERVSDALQRLASALPDARASQKAELDAFVSFNSILVQYLQQITPYIDTKSRVVEASLDEVRMAAPPLTAPPSRPVGSWRSPRYRRRRPAGASRGNSRRRRTENARRRLRRFRGSVPWIVRRDSRAAGGLRRSLCRRVGRARSGVRAR
jgi:hypothetical protein